MLRERASGSVVALAAARVPASVPFPVIDVAPGAEACVFGCACVCVKVCVCLSMVRSETIRAASFVLSPVSVGVQNLTLLPSTPGCFQKKCAVIF